MSIAKLKLLKKIVVDKNSTENEYVRILREVHGNFIAHPFVRDLGKTLSDFRKENDNPYVQKYFAFVSSTAKEICKNCTEEIIDSVARVHLKAIIHSIEVVNVVHD